MKHLITGLLFLSIFTFSCNKSTNKHSCYDKTLFKTSEKNFCTTDCPGFEGCDGYTYCNSCEAAKSGIGPK